jgi:hypothetical protein
MLIWIVFVVHVTFAAKPGWGEYTSSSCKTGLKETLNHCCWKGQSWKKNACVGFPTCPNGWSQSDNTCSPPSCPVGQVRVSSENWGKCCQKGQTFSNALNKCIGKKPIEAIKIPSGIFSMGCTSEQGQDCHDDEKPSHQVTLTKDFYLMKTEVTDLTNQKQTNEI